MLGLDWNSVREFATKHVKSGTFFVFALGMCIMNGKQTIAWNVGIFWFGFYVFLICTILAGLMSIFLTYGFSEMVSIVPFSGGCYGYVRCTLGPVAGFTAGVMEACKYILYTAVMVDIMAGCFISVYELQDKWEPLIWLAFFCVSISIQLVGNRVIWWTWTLVAFAALTFQFMFIFGSASVGSVDNLVPSVNRWQEVFMAQFFGTKYFAPYTYPGLAERFMRCLPFCNFLFCGIDAVRTCANDQSNKSVPYAMVFVDYWTFAIVIGMIVAARAYVTYTYELVTESFPYNAGIELAYPHMANKFVTFLSLPGSLGTALGFNYASGRQVRSMACSGLLPAWLSTTHKTTADESSIKDSGRGTTNNSSSQSETVYKETKPVIAIIFCSVLSFLILIIGRETMDDSQRIFSYIRFADLQTCIEACATSCAFIVFATRFAGMDASYRSPVGIPGAIMVIIYFTFTFVTMLHYDYDDRKGLCLALFVYTALWLIYYGLVANKRQFYSKEEQDKFMKAYIVNANKRRRHMNAKQRTAENSEANSSTMSNNTSSKKFLASIQNAMTTLSAAFQPQGGTSSSASNTISGLTGNNRVAPLSTTSGPAIQPFLLPEAAEQCGTEGLPAVSHRVQPCNDPAEEEQQQQEEEQVAVRPPETVTV